MTEASTSTSTMPKSRVGRKPVAIPSGVEVKVQDHELAIKGPKGRVVLPINPLIQVVVEGSHLKVMPTTKDVYCRSGSGAKLNKSLAGTVRATIGNIMQGVTKGFERKLVLVGVGYRAQMKGKTLGLSVGFSHSQEFTPPEGITIEVPSQTELTIKGLDKHWVGQVAAKIRAIRPPELYKGKGIRYADEVISLKETKKK